MTALANDRKTGLLPAGPMCHHLPVEEDTLLYGGAMTALNQSGYLVPASADPTLRVLGASQCRVDNTDGEAGDLDADVLEGRHGWDNSEGDDAITDADRGSPCYAVDDHTVARTSGGGARPVAGVVAMVDGDLVYVESGVHVVAQVGGGAGANDVLLEAGESLATKQFTFVKLNTDGDVVAASGAGEACRGVLQNAPASGGVAIVRTHGLTSVIASATIEENVTLATTSAGKSKAAVALTGNVAVITTVSQAAQGAFTDPPSAAEMAALRTLVNQLRVTVLELETAAETAQATTGSFVMGWAVTPGSADVAHQMYLAPGGGIPGTAA